MIRNFVLALAIFACFGRLASAATLDVPGDYPTIQSAIDASVKGDVVEVAPGTYYEWGLVINKGITLRSTNPDDRLVVAATVIDACAIGPILRVQNRLQVATVEGLTLRNGYAQNGAGLFLNYTIPTIRNCVFENCAAWSQGGAVYYTDSSQEPSYATFKGCRFVGNTAVNGGSAMYAAYASPNLLHCNVVDNDGRALMFVYAPSPTIENCVIAKNDVGVYCVGSSPVLYNCTIADHVEEGLFVSVSGDPILSNSIVWNGGIWLSGPGAKCTAAYSNVVGGWSGVGNIDADPLFRSFRGYDYLLSPGSPAIDAGDPAIADGMTGPRWYHNGVRSDMGAYGGPGNAAWLD